MRRFTSRVLLVSFLLGSSGLGVAPAFAKPERTAKAPAAKSKKPASAPARAKVPPPSAENKKKLAELYADFKFGMTKEEIVAVLGKQLDARYNERIKETTDVTAQDRLRKDKKAEIARVNQSFVAFNGKHTGWDVSIIEDEFGHHTGESMLERWENQDGRNQRRFFFFRDGKLWKMFVSLDVSILPEDKKNFETFQSIMTAKYGPGEVSDGKITWRTPEFEVRALDKLKSYDALGLAIEDPRVKQELLAARTAKAPPKQETSAVIKAVIDTDGKDKPDIKQNSNAVDAVIKAQGASTPK